MVTTNPWLAITVKHTTQSFYVLAIKQVITCVSVLSGGFCWSKALLSTCTCWHQLVHLNLGEDNSVVFRGTPSPYCIAVTVKISPTTWDLLLLLMFQITRLGLADGIAYAAVIIYICILMSHNVSYLPQMTYVFVVTAVSTDLTCTLFQILTW